LGCELERDVARAAGEFGGEFHFGILVVLAWDRAGEDDVGPGRLEPLSIFIEAGVEAAGADDYVGGFFEGAVFDHFENILEAAGEFTSAAGEEAGGVGVTVEGGVVGDVVVFGDVSGATPADEVALDGVAVGMGADGAAAVVAVVVGRKGWIGGGRVNSGFGRRGGDWV